MTDDMLALSTHLPVVSIAAGEVLVREGASGGSIWVLLSGRLQVSRRGVVVNAVTEPGAVIGEMSVLLGSPYGATVEAIEPCVLRHAADGAALLAHHPAITRLLAAGLAERLNFLTSYLVDLKHQYGEAPGLTMVSDVLRQISQRQAPRARPGSVREPDPEH